MEVYGGGGGLVGEPHGPRGGGGGLLASPLELLQQSGFLCPPEEEGAYGNADIYLGANFDSFEELKTALTKYSIEAGFTYAVKKSDRKRFMACCKFAEERHCPFYLRAYARGGEDGIVQITRLKTGHLCQREAQAQQGGLHLGTVSKHRTPARTMRLLRLSAAGPPGGPVGDIDEAALVAIASRAAGARKGSSPGGPSAAAAAAAHAAAAGTAAGARASAAADGAGGPLPAPNGEDVAPGSADGAWRRFKAGGGWRPAGANAAAGAGPGFREGHGDGAAGISDLAAASSRDPVDGASASAGDLPAGPGARAPAGDGAGASGGVSLGGGGGKSMSSSAAGSGALAEPSIPGLSPGRGETEGLGAPGAGPGLGGGSPESPAEGDLGPQLPGPIIDNYETAAEAYRRICEAAMMMVVGAGESPGPGGRGQPGTGTSWKGLDESSLGGAAPSGAAVGFPGSGSGSILDSPLRCRARDFPRLSSAPGPSKRTRQVCSLCKAQGHNARTCKEPTAPAGTGGQL